MRNTTLCSIGILLQQEAYMEIVCPNCKSDNAKKLSLIYKESNVLSDTV
jgi:phage FluMu protein Com